MKKTLLTLAASFLIMAYSHGQVFVNIEGGANVSQKFPLAGFTMGANFLKGAIFQTGFMVNITNNVNGGAAFYGLFGMNKHFNEYWSISPAVGYSATVRNTGAKEPNVSGIMASFTLLKDIERASGAQWFISTKWNSEMLALTGGIRVSLIRHIDGDCRGSNKLAAW